MEWRRLELIYGTTLVLILQQELCHWTWFLDVRNSNTHIYTLLFRHVTSNVQHYSLLAFRILPCVIISQIILNRWICSWNYNTKMHTYKKLSQNQSCITYTYSDVRIVFFHFKSNRIVFAVLRSRHVKFVFFLKCELQLLKFELNSKFVCVLEPEEREINFVHYFLHAVCVTDHPSCATGPASQWLAMPGCSWAEVVFLTRAALTRQHAACASQSDSITLAGPVSPHTLNAACLHVKVESIKILTARPALNWPWAVCLPPL